MMIKLKIIFSALFLSVAFISICDAAETVVVGGYEFAPFVQKMPNGKYDGVTIDLITALN